MLVLSRKELETIRIGTEIEITIVRLGPGVVRIGIDAPKDLRIVRGELDIITQESKGHDHDESRQTV